MAINNESTLWMEEGNTQKRTRGGGRKCKSVRMFFQNSFLLLVGFTLKLRHSPYVTINVFYVPLKDTNIVYWTLIVDRIDRIFIMARYIISLYKMMWYFMKNFEQLVVQKILKSYQIKMSGKNWTLDFTTTRVCTRKQKTWSLSHNDKNL